MRAEDMKERTKAFAVRTIRLVDALPRKRSADELGRQLLRSGTSVGANYRAACRARSRKEFVAKLGIVEEECDESIYWLELLIETEIVKRARLLPLMKKAGEILAITVASIRTAARRVHAPSSQSTGSPSKRAHSIRLPRRAHRKSAFRIPKSAMSSKKSAIRNPKSAMTPLSRKERASP